MARAYQRFACIISRSLGGEGRAIVVRVHHSSRVFIFTYLGGKGQATMARAYQRLACIISRSCGGEARAVAVRVYHSSRVS